MELTLELPHLAYLSLRADRLLSQAVIDNMCLFKVFYAPFLSEFLLLLGLKIFPGHLSDYLRTSYEKNFPAQHAQARTYPRFSCPYGNTRRPQGDQCPSRQGQSSSDTLIGSGSSSDCSKNRQAFPHAVDCRAQTLTAVCSNGQTDR